MASIEPRIVAAMLAIVALAWVGMRLTASREALARAQASLGDDDRTILAEAPRRLATGPRDPRWSSATEAVLNGAFARVTGLVGTPLVRCAASSCRIAGRLPATGPARDMAMAAIEHAAIPLSLRTGRLRAALTRVSPSVPVARFAIGLVRGPLPRWNLSS